MQSKEYRLITKEWNSFLLKEEKKLIQEKLQITSLLASDVFLNFLDKKGIEKTAALPLAIISKMIEKSAKGRDKKKPADLPRYEDVIKKAVEIDPNNKIKKKDYETAIKVIESEGKTIVRGLSAKHTGSGGSVTKTSGWKTVVGNNETGINFLKKQAQESIDNATKKLGNNIKAVSYGMHYLKATNVLKFTANIKEMKRLVSVYKEKSLADPVPYNSWNIKKFAKAATLEEKELAAYTVAAILTCSDLPDECATFSSGIERATTISTYAGSVSNKEASAEFSKTVEESIKFAHSAGDKFYAYKRKIVELLFNLSEGKKQKYGSVSRLLSLLVTKKGDEIDKKIVTSLFRKISEVGIIFFEDGIEETKIASEVISGATTDTKGVDTSNIVDKDNKKLKASMKSY